MNKFYGKFHVRLILFAGVTCVTSCMQMLFQNKLINTYNVAVVVSKANEAYHKSKLREIMTTFTCILTKQLKFEYLYMYNVKLGYDLLTFSGLLMVTVSIVVTGAIFPSEGLLKSRISKYSRL